MGTLAGAIVAVLLGTFGLATLTPSRLRGGRSAWRGPAQPAAPEPAADPPPEREPEPGPRATRGAPLAAHIAGAALVVFAVAVSTFAIWLALTRLAASAGPAGWLAGSSPVAPAIVAALLWSAVILWIVPRWQAQAWRAGREVDPKEAFDVENSARATLGQILAGIAVLAGLVVAWQQLGQTSDNLRVSEEGQITERFTRAIDQLGSADLTVRLGGIYALERIADDSPRDYATTMDVLTAFARERPGASVATPGAAATDAVPEDVAAVMRVIGRRTLEEIALEQNAGLDCLHLEEVRLPGADLRGYDLTHVCLNGATLSGALLQGADLSGIDLSAADLTGANLGGVNLRGAVLSGASFVGANLSRANLSGANLLQAKLNRAILEGSDLSDATLLGADLSGAFVLRTNLTRADLLDAVLTQATISTDLSMAQHLTATQLNAAFLDRNARLPAGVVATPDF